MASRIPEEKEHEVLLLLDEGDLTYQQIANMTGIHKYTVAQVALRNGRAGKPRKKKFGDDVRIWLLKNWHFEKPNQLYIKKKRHSQFRTPYNYPAMWKD